MHDGGRSNARQCNRWNHSNFLWRHSTTQLRQRAWFASANTSHQALPNYSCFTWEHRRSCWKDFGRRSRTQLSVLSSVSDHCPNTSGEAKRRSLDCTEKTSEFLKNYTYLSEGKMGVLMLANWAWRIHELWRLCKYVTSSDVILATVGTSTVKIYMSIFQMMWNILSRLNNRIVSKRNSVFFFLQTIAGSGKGEGKLYGQKRVTTLWAAALFRSKHTTNGYENVVNQSLR